MPETFLKGGGDKNEAETKTEKAKNDRIVREGELVHMSRVDSPKYRNNAQSEADSDIKPVSEF